MTNKSTKGAGPYVASTPISEEHFRLLVESVRDYAIFLVDPEGRVATWNAGAKAIKGYSPDEILGKHISTFYAEEDRAKETPQRLLKAALENGRVEDEGWRIRKDGTRFWADVILTALHDSDGKLVGFAKVTRDLTSRREAEEKLRRAEEMLAATLYSIGDGVLATNERAQVTLINRVAERLTGWMEKEALGRPIDEVFNIINEESRAKAFNPVARVLREGIVVGLANHTALISRNGTERPIRDSGAPIRDPSGRTRGAVLVFRDATEERRGEEAVREREERLRLMIGSVRDYAIFMLDPNGHVTSWNSGAQHITGYREDEIIGVHFSRLFTTEDIGAGKPAQELDRAARDGRFEDETWRVRKNGTRFLANSVTSAIRDGSGQLLGFTKVTRDLTERRKAEDERMRLAKAREGVRLRDEFLSIASHELKTPLTALQLQLQGLADRVSEDERLANRLAKAMRAGNRLADLIDTLLDVSRIATGRITLKSEVFDLVEAARDIVDRLHDAAGQAGCEVSFEPDGPVVGEWDRLRLEQILTNLLANAIKYAPRTPIRVTVKQEQDAAVVDVLDQGPGLREEDLLRVFGRFERASSEVQAGMGLGLYIARQVAETHGGTVAARNLDNGGACFTVRLPLRPVPAPKDGGAPDV